MKNGKENKPFVAENKNHCLLARRLRFQIVTGPKIVFPFHFLDEKNKKIPSQFLKSF